MRTLLRYPGGKSRAVKYLSKYIPGGLDEICSPFFGGGALEISLARKGVRVNAYDSFDELVIFWQQAFHNPLELAESVRKYHPLTKEQFYRMQADILTETNELEIAAMFYALNRSSFSGTTLSGGMSPGHSRFNENSIERLASSTFDNITIEKADFSESIPKNSGTFMYCDPPYLVESELYGVKGDKQKGFNHNLLREILGEADGWVLSYNNHEYICKLYDGYKIVEAEWAYGMNKSKTSNEIVIINE